MQTVKGYRKRKKGGKDSREKTRWNGNRKMVVGILVESLTSYAVFKLVYVRERRKKKKGNGEEFQ